MQRPSWRWNRSTATDLVLTLVIVTAELVFSVTGILWRPDPTSDPVAPTFVNLTMVASAALLLVRRTRPLLVCLAAVASTSALAALLTALPASLWLPGTDMADQLWTPLAVPFACYAAIRYSRDRWAAWALVAVLTLLLVRPWNFYPTVSISALMFTAFPALLGMYVGARRRLVDALTERAERAEREQHLLAEQARADERARLAGEMHDIVSHRISLMVLQAGALRMSAGDPGIRQAAEDLRASGAEALHELRELVGVLRAPERTGGDEAAAADPDGPAVPDLSALVAESESVGVPVELVEEGDPSRASGVVGRTAYRIVQESLTNVRKHAPGARVRVGVRHMGDRVRLTVRNAPPTAAADPALTASGSGSGLLGLRQRVELVGGTLRAGPADDGGFEVDVTLPAYVPTAEDPAHAR
ncbi:sensor histidine kinase [Allonocardiopsis opalescens]|uniref:histidine kinase n=1 Tax=Allonocardiopsis opalescens TaxID=1144618 RepID=A0A2T0PXP2_9ACTN|nr:histidine kinase [Allonocardiopsis opalescens]PRX96311.1 signal transduction histidine kinase [Allonocardiopsis opalescens]